MSEQPVTTHERWMSGARLRGVRHAGYVALVGLLLLAGAARGDGFQLERYEPSAPGGWFFGVESPWYSSTRLFAAGLALDYGRNPLLGGSYTADGHFDKVIAIVDHQLVGHLGVAVALFDRVQLSLSLPVVLDEGGTPGFNINNAQGAALGDPRVGALARVWGQPEKDALSIHAGAFVWIPVGSSDKLAGDPGVRFMPELVLAGLLADHFRWALSGGLLLRNVTQVGAGGPASSVGSELDVRAAIGWSDSERRITVGPEAWFSTSVTGFDVNNSQSKSLEVLLGAQWNIARIVQVGAAIGGGFVPTLGTPDVRVILTAAWAPRFEEARPIVKPLDSDHDGVPDSEDACPNDAGDPANKGCPRPRDADGDGVPEAEDLCPNESAGAHPDPNRKGCPNRDVDGDGVPEAEDLCPGEAAGAHPDPNRKGCPNHDVDGDGVPEAEDLCPDQKAGEHPDPLRKGCPAKDSDKDGIPDTEDACPNLAGPRDADPKKNGCPHVEDKGSRTTLKSVRFATAESTLLPEGLPVLDDAAQLIVAHPEVKHLVIEGHADDTGNADFNLKLSRARAESVVKYLVDKGVARGRLKAVGYGDTRPLSTEHTDEARAANRRVELSVPVK